MYKRLYSILSRGTEKASNSEGYMWIGSSVEDQEYIVAPVFHNIKFLQHIPTGLLTCGIHKDINLIAFCRFALMANLLLNSNKFLLNDKNLRVAIVGAGAVGITAGYEFLRAGFEFIDIVYKEKHLERVCLMDRKIKFICSEKFDPKKYGIIVDATGSSAVILDIVKNSATYTKIFLLGVPFKDPKIGLLEFYRKNLTLIGCHELRVSEEKRREFFLRLLADYSKSDIDFSRFVECHKYDEKIRKELLEKDAIKPINIFNFG